MDVSGLVLDFYWIFAFLVGVLVGYTLSSVRKKDQPSSSGHRKKRHHHSRHRNAHKESSPDSTGHSRKQ